ncbi:MAG: MiaB/RimO family radical SAM methylthiotransferase [Elusimicrobia bacterium]|nr:MiaB/RimO family radical SAM methylthiotransferase [Elusimicrobiota bacterium]
MTVKYFFHTFGCRVNQYETQALRERLLAGGPSEGVERWSAADVCLINTCTVTREADRDALRLIRQIARRNPGARLVVTGCLASRDPELILREAPAAQVVANKDKDLIPSMLGCQSAPALAGLSGFHGRSRAFVKIQDGCNMHCAYCIIPSVRSELSCKPWESLEAEAAALVRNGYRELVLCGIRLGRYLVQDRSGRRVDFVEMLKRLLAFPGDFRVRLSSIEVTDITDRFIALMAESQGKLCPSLHVPIQSASEAVLKRMGRWYSAAFYARRAAAVRDRLPRVGLFTDVMAGFPGETEAEFEESMAFVRAMGYAGLHVFRYSRRAGTPASRLKDQVPEPVILERAERMRGLDRELRSRFAERAVGSRRRVLLEGEGSEEGLAEDFLALKLDFRPGPGFHDVLVTSASGPRAYACVQGLKS